MFVEAGLSNIYEAKILEGDYRERELEAIAQEIANKMEDDYIESFSEASEEGYDFHESWCWGAPVIAPEYENLFNTTLLEMVDKYGYDEFVKNYCNEYEWG